MTPYCNDLPTFAQPGKALSISLLIKGVARL